jgi:hypothetical protein
MKKLVGLVAVVAILGAMLLPTTQASAATAGAAVGACQITLQWPETGPSSDPEGCGAGLPGEGSAVGALLPGGPVCLPLCTFHASVPYYLEDCILTLPPLLGEAAGQLFLNGEPVADYTWQRVGLVAVITVDPTGEGPPVDHGAGVAAFVPEPPLGACNNPVQMKAHVAGAVFAVQAP